MEEEETVEEEVGEEVEEMVGLVNSSWDSSSPLLVRLAARAQLVDVLHSTFTWVVMTYKRELSIYSSNMVD